MAESALRIDPSSCRAKKISIESIILSFPVPLSESDLATDEGGLRARVHSPVIAPLLPSALPLVERWRDIAGALALC